MRFYNSKPNCFNAFNRLLGLYFSYDIEVVGAFPLKLMMESYADLAGCEVPSYRVL